MLVSRKFLLLLLVVVFVISIKAFWFANRLSNKALAETEEVLSKAPSFSDVSVENDGLNITLTGSAESEVKALERVSGIESIDKVNYVVVNSGDKTNDGDSSDQPMADNSNETKDSVVDNTNNLNELFKISPIVFESGSSQINEQSKKTIKNAIEIIKQMPAEQRLKIIGHTDTEGDKFRNLTLSQRRSQSVIDCLVQEGGLSAEKFEVEGRGETQPLVSPEKDLADKQQNRRIEWELLTK